MKILSAVQEIIRHKSINDIVYIEDMSFGQKDSVLSKKIDIDYWSMISDPPSNDSSTTDKDLSTVISLANNRNQKDIDLVYLVDTEPLDLFIPIISKHKLYFPKKTFATMYGILADIVMDIKYVYNRPRPFQLAKYYGLSLDVIHTKTHRTPAYPSGHMAYACLAAEILNDMYPEYSTEFFDTANSCGLARTIQGVHFPSDNQASLNLVKKLYPILKTKTEEN